MKRKRKRGAGGRFVSSKKRARRRSSKRRRKTTAVVVASNPRRRRRRTSARRRSSRKRSIYSIKSNPTRRRRGLRRRRNPGSGLSGGQIALATVVGAASFAGATILVPRIMPQQLASSPVLWGIGMMVLGGGFMLLLRKYPVVALSAGVPVAGAGAFLASTGWLAKSGQQQPAPQGANLGAVVLEDLERLQARGMRGMGAVYPAQLGMGAVFPNQLGMGAVYPTDMGAVEAMVGDMAFQGMRAPSVALGMGAF
jgi:hypothetical protein